MLVGALEREVRTESDVFGLVSYSSVAPTGHNDIERTNEQTDHLSSNHGSCPRAEVKGCGCRSGEAETELESGTIALA
jgi:hypothetical protein